jgi:hypothetical protein
MKIDKFFEKLMAEENPKAGKIRRWWERKKMELWLKLPSGRDNETNADFVEQIIDFY